MNENTAKLIEQLAKKLGTTSEYLWSILIRQARIDATITLIGTIVVLAFGFVLFKLHMRFSKPITDGRCAQNLYDKQDGEGLIFAMISGTIIFSILLIVVFCCFPDVINGYFNPEYWALNKVISSLK